MSPKKKEWSEDNAQVCDKLLSAMDKMPDSCKFSHWLMSSETFMVLVAASICSFAARANYLKYFLENHHEHGNHARYGNSGVGLYGIPVYFTSDLAYGICELYGRDQDDNKTEEERIETVVSFTL